MVTFTTFYPQKRKKNGFVYNRVCNLPVERHRLLLALLQVHRLVRENLRKGKIIMYTALFIISLVMFGYLMYVLIKPEKF